MPLKYQHVKISQLLTIPGFFVIKYQPFTKFSIRRPDSR